MCNTWLFLSYYPDTDKHKYLHTVKLSLVQKMFTVYVFTTHVYLIFDRFTNNISTFQQFISSWRTVVLIKCWPIWTEFSHRMLEGMVEAWHLGKAVARQEISVRDHIKVDSFKWVILATVRIFCSYYVATKTGSFLWGDGTISNYVSGEQTGCS